MLRALEKGGPKGNKWFSLIDKVASERTLGTAWEQVRFNAGVCGVDRVSVAGFEKDSESRLLAVKEHLSKGGYRPHAVRRVMIPKSRGRFRPLGIPTVRDRVVQTALKMVIEPIFEREFCPWSYGFRPGVGCKDALREVERHLKAGFTHIVDIDIEGYFDNIDHELLMEKVRSRVADSRVLGLIEGFLKQGVMEEGVTWLPEKGSPQGGVISPLLANIYLNELDWLMNGREVRLIRYADDMVLMCRSQSEARAARRKLEEWMEAARLTLSAEKTREADMQQEGESFDFLGYRFKRGKEGRLLRLVRPESLAKLKDSVRRKTRRCNKHSMETICQQLEPVLRGWFGYFKHANVSTLGGIDGWIRMRLRSILRKRRGGRGRGRGRDHQRWRNDYFREAGFYSLVDARNEYLSLRKGVNC
jgi:RNA-directed DNA polymerase